MKLVVGMLIRNEWNRYLPRVLSQVCKIADSIVLLDDASTDDTPLQAKEFLKRNFSGEFSININKHSNFGEEYKVRKQLWNLCEEQNPTHILILDADELFEESKLHVVRELMDINVDFYGFRLYDMWTDTHYRSDNLWCAHTFHVWFMLRYKPYYEYRWDNRNHHVSRIPSNSHTMDSLYFHTNIGIKHYGWSRPEDRISKYHRYMKFDPKGEYGSMEKYQSILDPSPHLELFE